MAKSKNKKSVKFASKLVRVKTGTVEDFFSSVREVMKTADLSKPVTPRFATLTFSEPADMLHFLSISKIKLINIIRKHPDTITNIAKVTKRNRASVYRDISELEKFGIVKTHEEINPGHGRHKIVELVASKLKLEVYL